METLLAVGHESQKKFLGGDRIPCFITKRTFNRLNYPFAKIVNLSELDLRHSRYICLLQRKEVISMNNGSNTHSRKQWQ